MATLVIRNVEDSTHRLLKARAHRAGRSVAEEVRCMLRHQIVRPPAEADYNWVDAIRAIVEPLGGIDLPQPPRGPDRVPLDFSGPEWDAYDKP